MPNSTFPNPGPYEFMIEEGDLVFDIGACVGQMTEFYLSRGARVLAVEPEKKDIKALNRRFSGNERVTILHCAVGAKEESRYLYVHDGANAISTFVPSVWWGRDSAFAGTNGGIWEKVNMVTLDSLIDTYGLPQFIKLDIEGYESFALQGLSIPIPYLQFEVCVATMKSGQVDECFDCIERISPNAQYNYTLTEGPCFRLGETPCWHWTTAEEVKESLNRESSQWRFFWGNVFVNMVEDC